MKDLATTIALNERVTETTSRLRVAVDWPSYDPGQFVMLAVPGGETFLRRPFGIAGLAGGHAEICYKVVGKGTAALARSPAGTPVNILGPCGRGFSVPTGTTNAVLVAGGYGIGPLYGLAEKLAASKTPTHVFYGGRDASHLLYLDELAKLGVKLHLATEDGSRGHRGFVTELLERELPAVDAPALFACGPHGLLAAVARIGLARAVPTQVSMEAYMACGMGVCMGCVCKDKDANYVRTCREGPVFDAKELDWA